MTLRDVLQGVLFACAVTVAATGATLSAHAQASGEGGLRELPRAPLITRDRAYVNPRSGGVYNERGRRLGTIERRPSGNGYKFYDRKGTRRN